MIKSLLTIIILIFLGAASIWLYENPGAVQVVWLGYEITSNIGIFAAFILVLGLSASLLFWLLGRILSLPNMILGRIRKHKKAQGLAELESALIALTAENKSATQKAVRAAELLQADKLSHLGIFLQAEAALQAGNLQVARKHYQSLSNEKEFAFLGYRGLSLVESKQGNFTVAIDHALMAQKLDKNSLWALRVLAELYEQVKDYESAIDILSKAESQKLLDKDSVKKNIARLYLLLAKDAFQDGNDIAAMENAKAGYKRDESLQGILSLLAILHAKKADYKEAEKILSPLLQSDTGEALATYADILNLQFPNNSADAVIHRLSQAEGYLGELTSDIQVVCFLADLSLKAMIWGKARSLLESVPLAKHNALYCRKMAQLEQAENGNAAAAKAWLEKAESL